MRGARFGDIPGVPLFSTWKSRKACSDSGVHCGLIAGIQGSGVRGAYSIVLSGQYNDDDDGGETFMYTGTGGLAKVTSKGKATKFGKQIEDQSFKHFHNKALLLSCKNQTPVRVVRGYKCDSKYAPAEGYRYDGLYVVDEATLEEGMSGFKVCRFALRRLPGQGNIPVRTYEQTLANMKKTKTPKSKPVTPLSDVENTSDAELPPPSRSPSPSTSAQPTRPIKPTPRATASRTPKARATPRTHGVGRGSRKAQRGRPSPLARIRQGIAVRVSRDIKRLNRTRALQEVQAESQPSSNQ